MSANKKIEEGLEHMRVAEKSLKTSLLKWRPDYEIASDEYSKAATCFRNAKSFEQCKDCLLKATECHKQNRSLFHAARSLDQAILVCKEIGDLRDVVALADRACNMYQTHGSADAGACALDKAAKLLEQQYPEQALQLYQRAADIVMVQDNNRQGAEYYSKVHRLMVKLQMYDQAADAIRREIGIQQQCEAHGPIGRLAVALVLVQLARGDQVAAEKAFKEWGNYCDAPEVLTCESLLQAFDDEDAGAARRALNSPFIKHMDVEYARLARDLPLPQGVASAPKDPRSSNSAESPPAIATDEDYDGGLC